LRRDQHPLPAVRRLKRDSSRRAHVVAARPCSRRGRANYTGRGRRRTASVFRRAPDSLRAFVRLPAAFTCPQPIGRRTPRWPMPPTLLTVPTSARAPLCTPRNYTVEHLIEFFDELAAKLVRAGVRSDRLVDALKLVTIRTEILRHEREYAGPERRGSDRPWSLSARRRPGEPLR